MTLPELRKKALEMGVAIPDKTSKGNLLRLIRSSVSTGADSLMTIGRWKGCLYKEIPDDYGSWALTETERTPNSSPELIMYARWWKENRLNDPKETAIRDSGSDLEDPPPTSRATASSRGSWEQVSSTPTKGYRGPTGKGNTKAFTQEGESDRGGVPSSGVAGRFLHLHQRSQATVPPV